MAWFKKNWGWIVGAIVLLIVIYFVFFHESTPAVTPVSAIGGPTTAMPGLPTPAVGAAPSSGGGILGTLLNPLGALGGGLFGF